MNNNTSGLRISPEESIVKKSLDDIAREGAREMLQKALEIEVDLFLGQYQYILDDNGNREVVRNGHNISRKIITGAGQLEVRTPRVDDRVLDRHKEKRFKSSIVPPYLRRTKNIDETLSKRYINRRLYRSP